VTPIRCRLSAIACTLWELGGFSCASPWIGWIAGWRPVAHAYAENRLPLTLLRNWDHCFRLLAFGLQAFGWGPETDCCHVVTLYDLVRLNRRHVRLLGCYVLSSFSLTDTPNWWIRSPSLSTAIAVSSTARPIHGNRQDQETPNGH
jgi:hypothetical protein